MRPSEGFSGFVAVGICGGPTPWWPSVELPPAPCPTAVVSTAILALLSTTHLRSAPLTSRLGGESSALPPSLHHVLGTPELVTACSVRVEHVGHPACELRLQKHWRLSGKLSSRLDLAVLPGANQVEVILCHGKGPTV